MTMLCVLRRSTARLNASTPSIISRSYSASSTAWNHSFSFLKDKDPIECNISESIASKIGINLHQKPDHPICIIKKKIESYFNSLPNGPRFTFYDNLSPFVSVQHCFDKMLIPKDHISRRSTDSYYLNADTVLRTHMSAHDIELIQRGDRAFLATGDVYRRDAIDACHYPVFHQMDAVRFDPNLVHKATREEKVDIVKNDLKQTLEGMIAALFGQVDTRWVDAYFPFTEPSYELEIYFEGQWLEVLGCGVLQQQIIRDAGMGEEVAWAFGLGLERLAMVLFKIPDIRLFWSQDERFLSQFREGTITNFKPYSQYPECYKDVSFWHETDTFHENDLFEIIRNIAGDLVEKVILVDEFCHPKTQRQSKCFRIMYRHMDRNLTNAEVDQVQKQVRDQLHVQLKLDLR